MPQNNTDITSSPEFKEFCKNNNLEVHNLEAINVFLYLQESRIQKLEERLMEVASYIPVMSPFTTDDLNIKTLADKWKDTRSMITEEVMANAVKC